jgi:hypothetical protein
VLYADPTSETDDSALARSIQQAGNVVVAAQLVAHPTTGGPTSWLLALPAIERAAAAVGHVNVSTESDGVARQILIRAADDQGRAIRAMAVESIRIGDGIAEQSLTETSRSLLLGSRVIPVESIAPSVVIGGVPGVESSTQTLRAARMAIDYIGPAGSSMAAHPLPRPLCFRDNQHPHRSRSHPRVDELAIAHSSITVWINSAV